MSFAQFNFNPSISKALQVCGYAKPTPIQTHSIPDILEGKDLVASAQTGTGKTAAFILPALQRLSFSKSPKPRVLVLTPTRELAAQIIGAAGKYGKFLQFNMVTLIGGESYRQQLKGLSRSVDIIVATPGRLLDHMENRKVDLSGIEMLILDEADRMLDMGFIDDVNQIAKATPRSRQTLLFSATVDNKLSQVIQQLLKNPSRIDLSAEKLAPVSIKQQVYIADHVQHKTKLLEHFLKETAIFKAIIFCATKINTDKLAGALRNDGFLAAALHGDLKQAVRNRTIEQFRRGKIQFLVATDVAARGIDVADVTHVINFDLPKFSEDYVHRIGRTGRAGKTGLAISFVLPIDNRHLQKIERYMGQRLEIMTIPGLEATKSLGSSAKQKSKKKFGKKKFSDGKRFGDKPSGKNAFANKSHSSGFAKKKFSGEKRDGESRGASSKSYSSELSKKKFAGNKRFGEKQDGQSHAASSKSHASGFAKKKFADDKRFSEKQGQGGKNKVPSSKPYTAGFAKKKKFKKKWD